MTKKIDQGFTFIIFGGTGDLTNRKLIPALFQLYEKRLLPKHFKIVIVGRREYTQDDYYNFLYQSLDSNIINNKNFDNFSQHLRYQEMDYLDSANYPLLNQELHSLEQNDNLSGNRIYYLSVSQEHFPVVVTNLQKHNFINETKINRLMIEKPFGSSLQSAQELNKLLVQTFKEENIFRVDHYLGKEMLQNIMVIRFGNVLFESLWNHHYIDHIQITASETIGIESRGNFYDTAGAIRDMVQSHMLQLLSSIAMEMPQDLTPDSIKDEKVKVLKSIKPYSQSELLENIVRGQYGHDNKIKGYRQEDNVNPLSDTDTFVAMRLEIDNPRWKGVNFYLRTGKQMAKKSTEIVIQFKKVVNNLYDHMELLPNKLIIKIQPMEGIIVQFNAKQPGSLNTIIPVKMDFCQNCEVGVNSPEAYERLIYDVLRGDLTLFTRWDEVDTSWQFIDQIIASWQQQEFTFPNYLPGENGPIASDLLLEKFGHQWHNEEE